MNIIKRRTYIKKISDGAADILFPRRCAVCSKILKGTEKGICVLCRGKLTYIKSPFCKICGRQLEEGDGDTCLDCAGCSHSFISGEGAFVYDDLIKRAVYNFKYSNRREHGETLAREIVNQCGDYISSCRPDILIPVPIHRKRYIKRGYNQSEILARFVGGYTGINVRSDILFRTKNTKPQKSLTRRERMENLKGSFAICREKARGINTVILIDDIYTTGSTIENCSRLLRAAGVENIYFVCLCIGV